MNDLQKAMALKLYEWVRTVWIREDSGQSDLSATPTNIRAEFWYTSIVPFDKPI